MLTSLRRPRAFTLLELIVVIIILGILALLAVPTYNAVVFRSKEQAAQQTLRAVDRDLRAVHLLRAGTPGYTSQPTFAELGEVMAETAFAADQLITAYPWDTNYVGDPMCMEIMDLSGVPLGHARFNPDAAVTADVDGGAC